MTELTKYVCDLCGAVQELNTSPQGMITNYVKFTGMISNLDNALRIQSLCPSCAVSVGTWIKSNWTKTDGGGKENRVSTLR